MVHAQRMEAAVARVAMLLLAAFALTNVFMLARRLVGIGVAVATTIATAVFPIFFVQSSLTMPILWLRRSRYGESGFILKAAFGPASLLFVWLS